jgi:hypothetical protein
VHSNTAFGLALSLDYAKAVGDEQLFNAICAAASRLYGPCEKLTNTRGVFGSDAQQRCARVAQEEPCENKCKARAVHAGMMQAA